MTTLPPPPPPPPPGRGFEPPPPRPRQPRWVVALGIVIAAVVAIGAVSAVVKLRSDEDHPDEWDPRVADIAAFVEDERGLDFDHPVFVDFLSAEEYTEASTSD